MKVLRKLKFCVVWLLFICILFSNAIVAVSAESSYVLNNDGKEWNKKELYNDSGLPSSFKKVKYYDCQVPYKLRPKDIGGWAIKVEGNANYHPMSDDTKKNCYMGSYVNYQSDYSTLLGAESMSYEDDTGCKLLKDKNGTQYYVTAIQGYFYNSSNAGKNGFKTSADCTKQIFDIILTDGTVIHFVVGDLNAIYHTNGGTKDDGKTEKTHDGDWTYCKLKMKQYKNIYAGMAGNQLEMHGKSGCAGKFRDKYNIGTGKGKNRIAYYRMYNKTVADAPKPANNECKKKSYKLSISGVAKNTSKGSSVDTTKASKDGISFSNAGLYAESEFIKDNCLVGLEEQNIEFTSDDNLSKDQLKGVSDWKNNIDYENDDGLLKFIRVIVMFMGILFLVWMLFIYLCYWMDRINNFVDIDFLPMVTGGRLRVSPEEHECTFNPKNFAKGQPQTVNHRAILSICLIGIFFAVLVITGKLYDVINFLVRKILGWLGLV